MTRPCLRTDELTWKEIIGGGVFGEAGRKESANMESKSSDSLGMETGSCEQELKFERKYLVEKR
jgi:hypothetical protein